MGFFEDLFRDEAKEQQQQSALEYLIYGSVYSNVPRMEYYYDLYIASQMPAQTNVRKVKQVDSVDVTEREKKQKLIEGMEKNE